MDTSSEESASEFGLQPDGSVTLKDDDFTIELFRNFPCWKKENATITSDIPWIKKENWSKSYAMKYLNYEAEAGYINLENPLQIGDEYFVGKKVDKDRNNKSKMKKTKEDFSIIKEGVTDMDNNMEVKQQNSKDPNSDKEEDDDFIDAFGNVLDPEEKEMDSTVESGSAKKKSNNDCKKQKKRKFEDSFGFQQQQQQLEQKKYGKNKKWKDLDVGDEAKMNDTIPLPNSTPKNVSKSLVMQEPRYSYLKPLEQQTYLALLDKFSNNREPLQSMSKAADREDYKIFEGFSSIVKEEQEEFQKYVKSVFLTKVKSMAAFQMKPDIARYINEYYEHRLARARKYPRLFSTLKSVSNGLLRLVPQVNDQQVKPQYEMRPDKPLLEMGTIPKIIIPSKKRICSNPYMKVGAKYDNLKWRYPTNPDLMPGGGCQSFVDRKQFVHKNLISNDPNAEILAVNYLPDVIASVGVLKAIFDNFGPNFNAQWEIPFTVRTYGKLVNGKVLDEKRVIFVDKPLAPKKLSVHEKNAWYHKIAAKAFLLHPWSQSNNAKKTNKTKDLISSESKVCLDLDNPFDLDSDLSSLETFGTLPKLIPQVDGANELEKLAKGVERLSTEKEKQEPFKLSQVDGGNDDDDNSSDDEKLMIADEVKGEADEKQTVVGSIGQEKETLQTRKSKANKLMDVLRKVDPSVSTRTTRSSPLLMLEPRTTRSAMSPPKQPEIESGSKASRGRGRGRGKPAKNSPEQERQQSHQSTRGREGRGRGRGRGRGKVLCEEEEKSVQEPSLSARPGRPARTRKDTQKQDDQKTVEESRANVENEKDSSPKETLRTTRGRNRSSSSNGKQNPSKDLSENPIPSLQVKETIGKVDKTEKEPNEEPQPQSINDSDEKDEEDIQISPPKKRKRIISSEASGDEEEDDDLNSNSNNKNVDESVSESVESSNETGQEIEKNSYVKDLHEICQRTRQEKREKAEEKRAEKQKQIRSRNKGNILGNIIAAQSSMMMREKWVLSEQAANNQEQKVLGLTSENLDYKDPVIGHQKVFPPPPNVNINLGYRMWHLNDKEHPAQNPLRIIIRSSIHGMMKNNSPNNDCKLFTISSKMENQPDFGAESLTKSEMARDWISTLTRPGSYLTRLRINPQNQVILKNESKDLKNLSKDCLALGIKPGEQLGNVYTLFNEMKKIKEPGQYLLYHDSKLGPFVRVFKALEHDKSNNESTAQDLGDKYDLHGAFNSVQASDDLQAPPQWNKIDVNLITPWHFANKRVPGLFQPKPKTKFQ